MRLLRSPTRAPARIALAHPPAHWPAALEASTTISSYERWSSTLFFVSQLKGLSGSQRFLPLGSCRATRATFGLFGMAFHPTRTNLAEEGSAP